MSKQTSLEQLNAHLFETIEMLKNNRDHNASDNEKIDVDAAKTIADLGKVIVDGYKVKIQALNILSKADNPSSVKRIIIDSGIESEKSLSTGNETAI